ncbi:MAG TPA: PAS domain-containing protein, partial [Solirubrobacteraceae bacterium]
MADVLSPGKVVLTSLFIGAPLLLSLVVRPRLVGAVGALGLALALASPAWNHHFGRSAFWVPLSVNAIGTAAAVVSARRRVRLQALSHDLAGAEWRLQAILRNLDEAVTVQDAAGRSIFANEAAAGLLGLPSPEALLAASPGETMRRFEVTREDGTPVVLEELPAYRLIRGEPAEPTLVRNVVAATGEERWLLNRATAVAD